MVELMHNHGMFELLVILTSASDLLLHATYEMLIDGETYILLQL